ncbi:MAG: hypothetical protein HUJ77_10475 [Clostridium sp.]|uniref:hypothetical protein n=1 Tax=Clostridium sp. TaxID=1506 RepID=UPI0025C3BFE5|nr:hypothetical protein [Clostridium sp.]MCF0148805.1 hypothetical protein [Clostridium sp.]
MGKDFKISNQNEESLSDYIKKLDEKENGNFWHESIENITLGFMFTLFRIY